MFQPNPPFFDTLSNIQQKNLNMSTMYLLIDQHTLWWLCQIGVTVISAATGSVNWTTWQINFFNVNVSAKSTLFWHIEHHSTKKNCENGYHVPPIWPTHPVMAVPNWCHRGFCWNRFFQLNKNLLHQMCIGLKRIPPLAWFDWKWVCDDLSLGVCCFGTVSCDKCCHG